MTDPDPDGRAAHPSPSLDRERSTREVEEAGRDPVEVDRYDVDPFDTRAETADQRADRNWTDIMQELRVTQTGTQIVSGFLLAVAFQARFAELRAPELVVYGILVGLAALATALGLATVAVHRLSAGRHRKPNVVRAASRLLDVCVAAVSVLSIGVVTFIFEVVFGWAAGIAAGVAALLVIGFLVVVLPRIIRGPRHA